MSYSSISQGLQSCLEPKLIEPRVLNLKLAPPGSNSSHSSHSECPNSSSSGSSTSSINASFSNFEAFDDPISPNNTNNEHDMKRVNDSSEPSGGCTWSFLQSLSNISHCKNNGGVEDDNVYVHPKVKCSSKMLSAKSLEMCTESLGCETGSTSSDASEISDEMSLLSLENDSTCFMRNNTMQINTNHGPKRLNRGSTVSFPPPLTSITDFGGVQVRPHREDGRLILEAVTTTSIQSSFHAERSDGRLRLRLFESVSSCCGGGEDEAADEEEQEEGDDEGETLKNEECDEEDIGSKEELEKYEMEMTKFTTSSRCKESGRKRDIFGDGYFELHSLSLCL